MAELRDACRYCGKPVRFVRWLTDDAPEGVPREPRPSYLDEDAEHTPVIVYAYRRLHWEHVKTFNKRCEPDNEANMVEGLPANYCAERKTDGDFCNKRVLDEYKAEGIIACGVHARNVRAEIQQRRLDEERRQRMADEEEIAAMEAEGYAQARDALLAIPGAEEYLTGLKSYEPLGRWNRRVDKTIAVDVIKLLEFIRGAKELPEDDDGVEYIEWEVGEDAEA